MHAVGDPWRVRIDPDPVGCQGLLSLVVVVVSLVYIFTKPLRQAVWDQIAKTLVVRPAG